MSGVIVIGGGLAGITATIALRESGVPVTLLEARPKLGGATHSFDRDGLAVDNGQHVFLKCCTAYRGLLDRLGVADQVTVQPRFDVQVRTPHGRDGRLRRLPLPPAVHSPLHFGPALAGYRHLNVRERLGAVRAALAMLPLDPADPELDGVALGRWLARHGQGAHARRALWDLFVVSALNISTEEAALGLAAKVCKTALLGAADAADIGMAAVPLGELHGAAAGALLDRLGADVRVRTKVAAIEQAPRGYAVLAGGELFQADAVVLAVPHTAAADLVPAGAVPDTGAWRKLDASPILNVHVIYDRPVLDVPMFAAIDSPVQWVFDRTGISGLYGTGRGRQYLAVSVSAADDYIDTRTAELRDVFVPALADLMPAARTAGVTEFFVSRERRATFRSVPGSGALRPASRTRLPGCYLAGAWTATGWPDTMEGAVRSGLQAARLARRALPQTTDVTRAGAAR